MCRKINNNNNINNNIHLKSGIQIIFNLLKVTMNLKSTSVNLSDIGSYVELDVNVQMYIKLHCQ